MIACRQTFFMIDQEADGAKDAVGIWNTEKDGGEALGHQNKYMLNNIVQAVAQVLDTS